MHSRREIVALTLAGIAAPLLGRAPRASERARIGIQTRALRDLPRIAGTDRLDTLMQALVASDARECELFAPLIEAQFGGPHAGHHTMSAMSPQMMRRELRKWRGRTAPATLRALGERFRTAGVRVYAYNYSPDSSFTDQEINFGFETAKALGAEVMTASTSVDVAKRIVPFADEHRMTVALSRCSGATESSDVVTAQGLGAALKMSSYFKIHLDVGAFAAANVDPVGYLREHHDRITSVVLTDRPKNHDHDVPWGDGDAPIDEVLQTLKQGAWPMHVFVEYPRAGQTDAVAEVRKRVAYAQRALL